MRIGIDLGGTKIEGIALGDDGTEYARRRIPTPRGDYEATLGAVCGLIAGLHADAGPVTGVGLGTPGSLSPATGLIRNANSTWLNGKPLGRDLEQRLGRPVRLANDADCFALSEAVDGAALGAETVFGVILGTGVGGGIVAGGRLLRGPNAIAGEWGHNPLPAPRDEERPGPSCYCGRYGCIEAFLSGPNLARDHADRFGGTANASGPASGPTPPQIVRAAALGDAAAEATLIRYEDRLSRALASVINILDPDVIVLGGGLSKVARLYRNVPRLWGEHVFSDQVATRLLPPVHGDSGGVRGAACLWPPVSGPTKMSTPV